MIYPMYGVIYLIIGKKMEIVQLIHNQGRILGTQFHNSHE